VDGIDDLAAVDSLKLDAGDAEVGVAELALDDDEWDAFVGHLDRVSVAELVRRESSADTCCRSCMVELLAGGRGLPAPASGRPVNHA
jgi:hypothetical protein